MIATNSPQNRAAASFHKLTRMVVGDTDVAPARDLLTADPLTLEEVAERLQVSVRTVERLIQVENGRPAEMESIKLLSGNKSNRRVTQAQFKRFMEKREVESLRLTGPRPKSRRP